MPRDKKRAALEPVARESKRRSLRIRERLRNDLLSRNDLSEVPPYPPDVVMGELERCVLGDDDPKTAEVLSKLARLAAAQGTVDDLRRGPLMGGRLARLAKAHFARCDPERGFDLLQGFTDRHYDLTMMAHAPFVPAGTLCAYVILHRAHLLPPRGGGDTALLGALVRDSRVGGEAGRCVRRAVRDRAVTLLRYTCMFGERSLTEVHRVCELALCLGPADFAPGVVSEQVAAALAHEALLPSTHKLLLGATLLWRAGVERPPAAFARMVAALEAAPPPPEVTTHMKVLAGNPLLPVALRIYCGLVHPVANIEGMLTMPHWDSNLLLEGIVHVSERDMMPNIIIDGSRGEAFTRHAVSRVSLAHGGMRPGSLLFPADVSKRIRQLGCLVRMSLHLRAQLACWIPQEVFDAAAEGRPCEITQEILDVVQEDLRLDRVTAWPVPELPLPAAHDFADGTEVLVKDGGGSLMHGDEEHFPQWLVRPAGGAARHRVVFADDRHVVISSGGGGASLASFVALRRTTTLHSQQDADGYVLRVAAELCRWGDILVAEGFGFRHKPPDLTGAHLRDMLCGRPVDAVRLVLRYGERLPGTTRAWLEAYAKDAEQRRRLVEFVTGSVRVAVDEVTLHVTQFEPAAPPPAAAPPCPPRAQMCFNTLTLDGREFGSAHSFFKYLNTYFEAARTGTGVGYGE